MLLRKKYHFKLHSSKCMLSGKKTFILQTIFFFKCYKFILITDISLLSKAILSVQIEDIYLLVMGLWC